VWHYIKGSEADFAPAPEHCVAAIQQVSGRIRYFGHDQALTPQETIVAYREWITDEGWVEWHYGECPVDGYSEFPA
jgi:hypothetical protein